MELLSLALQGDVEDKKAIDLKQLLETSSSEEDSKSKEGGKTMDGLTESDLKEMEDELTKVLTPKQKQHAMKILRSFREGAPEKENEAAVVSLNEKFHFIGCSVFKCNFVFIYFFSKT